MRSAIALFTALGIAACDAPDPDAARAATVSNVLVADNLDIIYRAPELVAGKFAKMASAPYVFFRGSHALYLYDQTSGERAVPTRYGTSGAAVVQLVGDPHPENVGTYRTTDGDLVAEFNDFDAAHYGLYVHDVRRLGLGYYLLAVGAGLDESTAAGIAGAVAEGYGRALGTARAAPPVAEGGAILADLVEDALEDGAERKQLNRYTEVVDGTRRMTYYELELHEEGFIDREVVPLGAAELERVVELIEGYRATVPVARAPEFYTVKGASRRLGSGVSSYALYRYYVLVEGASAAVDDDVLLEMREVRDGPPPDPRLLLFPRVQFSSNGERVVTLQRRAHSSPLTDSHAGWSDLQAHSFKVRERSGYQGGLEFDRIHRRIADGRFSLDDLARVARWSGGLLAASHGRAPTVTGAPAHELIESAVGGEFAGFVAETTEFVAGYGPQLLDDYRLFRLALEIEGPLLGARVK